MPLVEAIWRSGADHHRCENPYPAGALAAAARCRPRNPDLRRTRRGAHDHHPEGGCRQIIADSRRRALRGRDCDRVVERRAAERLGERLGKCRCGGRVDPSPVSAGGPVAGRNPGRIRRDGHPVDDPASDGADTADPAADLAMHRAGRSDPTASSAGRHSRTCRVHAAEPGRA